MLIAERNIVLAPVSEAEGEELTTWLQVRQHELCCALLLCVYINLFNCRLSFLDHLIRFFFQ